MPSEFRKWQHRVPQGVELEPLDRISGRDGSRLVEADVSSVDVVVYDVASKTAILTRTALDPGAVTNPETRVFDTLQDVGGSGRWTADAIGYNARTTITEALLGSAWPLEGGKKYRVEIKWATTAWGNLYSVHEYTIEPIYTLGQS